MELDELKQLWQNYDKKLSENMKLNKDILRQILILKPEKRINWMKIKALSNLVLPVIIIMFMLFPNIGYRAKIDFYAGLTSFSLFAIVTYYWSVKYYLKLLKIDLYSPVIVIKKAIKELESYKIKTKGMAFILAPFGMTGVLLLAEIPFISKQSLLPLTIIVLVMILSVYWTFKYSIIETFRNLNKEIEELDRLTHD